eukprot:TRINITY_DN23587_c0_g1_i1.p1 TRINITY_DN23587_c0_g1~~TRINITY_DN23587_c0_g1_i1.p1  ORF type:complete len:311 (+),score=112.87 TRINITY_DN23587_c0_g1_i1:77-934(+)
MPSSLDGSSLLQAEAAAAPRRTARSCAALLQQVERLRAEFVSCSARPASARPAPAAPGGRARRRAEQAGGPAAAERGAQPPPRKPPVPRLGRAAAAQAEQPRHWWQQKPQQPRRASTPRAAPAAAAGAAATAQHQRRTAYAETLRTLTRRVDVVENDQRRMRVWRDRVEADLQLREQLQCQLAMRVAALAREAHELSCQQERLSGRLDGALTARRLKPPRPEPGSSLASCDLSDALPRAPLRQRPLPQFESELEEEEEGGELGLAARGGGKRAGDRRWAYKVQAP